MHDFRPEQLTPPCWLHLGEVVTACTVINQAAMAAEAGELMNYSAILHGVVASASLDGYMLSEDQVDRLLEGSLHLPPSQVYQERGIRSLIRVIMELTQRVAPYPNALGPWLLHRIHSELIKGLPVPDAWPGTRATGLSKTLEALYGWLGSSVFTPEEEDDPMPLGIIRAVAAHYLLMRLQPFEQANGRTARAEEFRLLLLAGVPPVAAHQMAIHSATYSQRYRALLASTGGPEQGLAAFIHFMVEGFARGVEALLLDVLQAQTDHFVLEGLKQMVLRQGTSNRHRLTDLVEALHEHGPVVSTSKLTGLSPALAARFAKLSAKTLQRDLIQLEGLGLIVRERGKVRLLASRVLPFAPADRGAAGG